MDTEFALRHGKKVWHHLFLSGKAGVDVVESATENAEFASTLRSNKSGQ